MTRRSCNNCEFAYHKLHSRGCEKEDEGKKVPTRLMETIVCPYWRLKGSREDKK